MKINNGQVQSGWVTDEELDNMEKSIQFVDTYKWEMGDVNTLLIPLMLLDANGVPIEGSELPEEKAKAICLAEGMKEEEITPEYLFERFMPRTEIQKIAKQTRGYLKRTKVGMVTQRVLSTGYKDPETGVYVGDIHDTLARLTKPMHDKLKAKLKEKLDLADIPEETKKQSLADFDRDKKPVKATKTRIAMEVVCLPLDNETFKLKTDPTKIKELKGILLTLGSDAFAKIKAHLHKPLEQTNLNFLEIKVVHPVKNKSSDEKKNKMDSGMSTDYGIFGGENIKPSNIIPDFKKIYTTYRETLSQDPLNLEAKVQDYRRMADAEALSLLKDYVMENVGLLTEEEKKKHQEIIDQFQTVLSAEEIEKYTDIAFSKAPNSAKGDQAPKDQAPAGTPTTPTTVTDPVLGELGDLNLDEFSA